MKIFFRKYIFSFLFAVLLMTPLFAMANNAFEGLNEAANTGYLGNEVGTGGLNGNSVMTDIPQAIGRIVGIVLSLVGVFFFLLMIYGGFTWMFARGNEQNVEKAKSIIQSAIIGMIIVLAAYAITVFIGSALTSSDAGVYSR